MYDPVVSLVGRELNGRRVLCEFDEGAQRYPCSAGGSSWSLPGPMITKTTSHRITALLNSVSLR